MSPQIVSVIGNPRPESRTHGLARTLTAELARVLATGSTAEVDLAQLGPRVLDPADNEAGATTDPPSQQHVRDQLGINWRPPRAPECNERRRPRSSNWSVRRYRLGRRRRQ